FTLDDLPAPVSKMVKNIDLNLNNVDGKYTLGAIDLPSACTDQLYDPATSAFCWESGGCPSIANGGELCANCCFNFGTLPAAKIGSATVNSTPLSNFMKGTAGAASGGAAGYDGLYTEYSNNTNWYSYSTYTNWCTPVNVPDPNQNAPAGSTISTCSGQFPVMEIVQMDLALDAQIIGFIYQAQQERWQQSQFSPPGCNLPQAPQPPTPNPGQFAQNLTSAMFVAPILAGVITGVVIPLLVITVKLLIKFPGALWGAGAKLIPWVEKANQGLRSGAAATDEFLLQARYIGGAYAWLTSCRSVCQWTKNAWVTVKNALTNWPKVAAYARAISNWARYRWTRFSIKFRSPQMISRVRAPNGAITETVVDNPAYQEATNVIQTYKAARI
ncbi:MAG TPA: hypothetical protein VJJ83_02450, partial [Candidatus Babeliales bacterium]|nr:hypothetical protein [Candidatus Babeliales bacterium]